MPDETESIVPDETESITPDNETLVNPHTLIERSPEELEQAFEQLRERRAELRRLGGLNEFTEIAGVDITDGYNRTSDFATVESSLVLAKGMGTERKVVHVKPTTGGGMTIECFGDIGSEEALFGSCSIDPEDESVTSIAISFGNTEYGSASEDFNLYTDPEGNIVHLEFDFGGVGETYNPSKGDLPPEDFVTRGKKLVQERRPDLENVLGPILEGKTTSVVDLTLFAKATLGTTY
jgi:hypothetical protein